MAEQNQTGIAGDRGLKKPVQAGIQLLGMAVQGDDFETVQMELKLVRAFAQIVVAANAFEFQAQKISQLPAIFNEISEMDQQVRGKVILDCRFRELD